MEIELRRFAYTPMGTFGKILTPAGAWFTVERQWRNNKQFVSCIPLGMYNLVQHHSSKFGDTFAVVGSRVSRLDDGGARYGILIHSANLATQLQGCIAPGNRLGVVREKTIEGKPQRWAVLNSRTSTKEVLAYLKSIKGDIRLSISFGPLDEGSV